MSMLFAVVYETSYSSKILMIGTKAECEKFLSEDQFYKDFAFIQELEEDYV